MEKYKKKGKKDLFVFFLFLGVIIGTILYLYVNNLWFKIIIYTKEEIKDNIIFTFLASFILLYIVRPLFLMFKGMLKEVR